VSPVRLIDQNNEQAGIVELKNALEMAREADLDLVEVAPTASPPVCRIMNYGKYKYDLAKKARKAKAHRHETELKEIRIRTPKIDEHDLMRYVGHAREFLQRGDRVQFSLRFRGRELAHIDEGRRVFDRVVAELEDCGKIEQRRSEGRRITMMLSPLPGKAAKTDKAEQQAPPAEAAQPAPQTDATAAE